jgi:hypothetical protein
LKTPFYIALFVLGFTSTFAQKPLELHHLKCSGKVPKDILLGSMQKASTDFKRIDSLNKRKVVVQNGVILKESTVIGTQKRNFHLFNHYSTDKLLKSGLITFNDSISDYVNRVADKILKNEPELREKLRFYTVKSSSINAFTAEQGIIFVNVGLIAQLKNEAQLAFVLCHEISHFIEGHAMDSYIKKYTISRGLTIESKGQTITQKLVDISNFSKGQELAADSLGLMLFLKTNYYTQAAIETLEILRESYFPFYNLKIEPDLFDYELNSFSEYVSFEQFNYEEHDFNEIPDSFSTHPDAGIRINALTKWLPKRNSTEKQSLLPANEFFQIQKIARHEVIRLNLLNGRYIKALYYALCCQEIYPKSSIIDLYKTIAINGVSTSLINAKPQEDERFKILDYNIQKLDFLLKNLGADEIHYLNIYNCLQLIKNHEYSIYEKLMTQSIKNLNSKDTTFIESFFRNGMSTDSNVSKTLISLCQMPKFKELYLAFKVKHTSNANNRTGVLVSNFNYHRHSKRGQSLFHLISTSEKGNIECENFFKNCAFDLNINLKTISPNSLNTNQSDVFNEYIAIREWIYENSRDTFNHVKVSQINVENLKEKYDVKYVVVPTIKYYELSKDQDNLYALASCLGIFSIPLIPYYLIRPQQKTNITFKVFDIETAQLIKVYNYKYSTKDHKTVIDHTIYDMLYSLNNELR